MTILAPRAHGQRGRAQVCALALLVLGSGCGEPEEVTQETTVIGDLAMMPPPAEQAGAGSRHTLGLGPTVLFLNFDGATIEKGLFDDSSKDTGVASGAIPPFPGSPAERSSVVAKVTQLFSAYNALVVTTRPASGDYHMAVIGGEVTDIDVQVAAPPAGSFISGLAPLDCGNKAARNIAFVFAETVEKTSSSPVSFTEKVASSTAHELGHTLGLPHSSDGCDVMSYGSCGATKTFLDKTMGMQDPAGTGFADPTCGLSSMNSHQMLLATLGKAGATPVDVEAPTVTLTSPTDGASVGPDVTVEATISDNLGVVSAGALVDGIPAASASAAPFAFPLSGLGAGPHELTVEALDAAGNKGSSTVTVIVSQPEPEPEPEPPQPVPSPPPPVDGKPPVVTITSPKSGATVSPALTVQAAITDDVGVTTAKLLIDGSVRGYDSAAPFLFPVSGLAGGKHTIVVEALDAAGNGGSASVTVTVTVTNSSGSGTEKPGGGGCHPLVASLLEENCSVANSFGEVSLPVVLSLLLLWVIVARRVRRPCETAPRSPHHSG